VAGGQTGPTAATTARHTGPRHAPGAARTAGQALPAGGAGVGQVAYRAPGAAAGSGRRALPAAAGQANGGGQVAVPGALPTRRQNWSPAPGRRALPGANRPGGRPTSRRGTVIMAALLLSPVAVVVVVVIAFLALRSPATLPIAKNPPVPTLAPHTPPGRWKFIAARATDPSPLTLSSLFPQRFTVAGEEGHRAARDAGTNCGKALIGKSIRAALAGSDCTQVMRATYLTKDNKMMATIGVLNLLDLPASDRMGKVSGPKDFIQQLPGQHGPSRQISRGTGLEEAEIMGHYLVLAWSGMADLKTPTGAERAQLQKFADAMIRGTANQELTKRLVNGS